MAIMYLAMNHDLVDDDEYELLNEEIGDEFNDSLRLEEDETLGDLRQAFLQDEVRHAEEEIADLFDEVNNERKRVGRALLTYFPPEGEEAGDWLNPSYFFQESHMPDNWVAQYELCPTTGQMHCHAYASWTASNRMRFNTLREAIVKSGYKDVRVHIRLPRSTSKRATQCAINYCTDPSKRMPGTESVTFGPAKWAFDEKTSRTKRKRDDEKEEQRLHIESKPHWLSWDEIVHENEYSKQLLCSCSWGAKYHAGRASSEKRRTIREVVILYGAGGTGKSTAAKDLAVRPRVPEEVTYWKRNPDDGMFFGGGKTAYRGQNVIHFEEFNGSEPFSRLKDYCDIGKNGPPVNVKNGGCYLNHETVVFTSNDHPASWYRKLWEDDSKQFMPFWRRITKVVFYPERRPDGSKNQPNAEAGILPFFIDQTDEWKSFDGDYEKCKAHAAIHWPIREVGTPGITSDGNPCSTARGFFDPTITRPTRAGRLL